ncbi:hypothetical protein [Kineococcus sp. SYSU DK005]|uniref:hypothetical protein n=1 Tax=Kineococcus sp. SYSU DK005 TaxID=3383126 RepID=UPI003D7DF523
MRPRVPPRRAGVPLTACRLRVDPAAVAARPRRRHARDHEAGDPEALEWHLRRSVELEGLLEGAGTEDVVVDVDPGRTPLQVARAVLDALGWDAARP